jgi:hypothetical protein
VRCRPNDRRASRARPSPAPSQDLRTEREILKQTAVFSASAIDFAENRLLGLVRKAVEREDITLARGAEILGLSLAQMRDLPAAWV